MKKNGRELPCRVCGKLVYVPAAQLERFRYCSKPCDAEGRRQNMMGNSRAVGHKPNATSFQRGEVPWNKGTKGIMKANATSFPPGQSLRELPIGSMTTRLDENGLLRNWIKTEDGWRPYAQVLWERERGPIPLGKLLHHIDWNATNDVIENLQPVTRAEHIEIHRSRLR